MRVTSPVPYKRGRIEIIPLIDIMFFVLASFMMVTLVQTHMKSIRVTVKDSVAIQVREGNAVYFDNQYVSPTEQRRKNAELDPRR
jgi:biopolymer transport protein ExbD